MLCCWFVHILTLSKEDIATHSKKYTHAHTTHHGSYIEKECMNYEKRRKPSWQLLRLLLFGDMNSSKLYSPKMGPIESAIIFPYDFSILSLGGGVYFFIHALVFWGCCNKGSQFERLNTTEIDFPTALEARNPKSSCQQDWPLGAVREDVPRLSLSFWWLLTILAVPWFGVVSL